jgi:hypothetical protein
MYSKIRHGGYHGLPMAVRCRMAPWDQGRAGLTINIHQVCDPHDGDEEAVRLHCDVIRKLKYKDKHLLFNSASIQLQDGALAVASILAGISATFRKSRRRRPIGEHAGDQESKRLRIALADPASRIQ